MMFWQKKPEEPKIDYEYEIARLKQELANCQKIISDINGAIPQCNPVIDFDTMRVFSIERLVNNNRPATIIGYFVGVPVFDSEQKTVAMRDEVKEWTLYCNNERHEELVKKFVDWKAKNV